MKHVLLLTALLVSMSTYAEVEPKAGIEALAEQMIEGASKRLEHQYKHSDISGTVNTPTSKIRVISKDGFYSQDKRYGYIGIIKLCIDSDLHTLSMYGGGGGLHISPNDKKCEIN